MPDVVERRCLLEAAPADVWEWHSRPGALERLTPPWARAEVVGRTGGLEPGARVVLRLGLGPFSIRWVAVHREVIQGREFVDEQETGPFASWRHVHRLEPAGPGRTTLIDRIEYRLPFGPAGQLLAPSVRHRIDALLRYRQEVLAQDLWVQRDVPPMHIALTGSHGLVGSALVPFLTAAGHRVTRIVRGSPRPGEVRWDPATGRLEAGDLAGVDAVVNLAGENLAGGRWTDARKRRLYGSRVDGTTMLARALAALSPRPGVLVSASAVGIYGDRGDESLTEESRLGSGFLADLARAWEEAAEPARAAGIRVAHPRLGLVLSPRGGALASLLPVFRAGLGGRVGNGRQWVSAQSVDDTVGAIWHAIRTDRLEGPVNLVCPDPVTNATFTRLVGRSLHRPTLFRAPAFALRLALGQMADETLLASQRALPVRLLNSGYRFRQPTLAEALDHVLGREPDHH